VYAEVISIYLTQDGVQWPVIVSTVIRGCTNPSSQVVQGTEFCTVASNICGSSQWKFLHITPDGAWNFELAHRFLENWCILVNNRLLVPRNASEPYLTDTLYL